MLHTACQRLGWQSVTGNPSPDDNSRPGHDECCLERGDNPQAELLTPHSRQKALGAGTLAVRHLGAAQDRQHVVHEASALLQAF